MTPICRRSLTWRGERLATPGWGPPVRTCGGSASGPRHPSPDFPALLLSVPGRGRGCHPLTEVIHGTVTLPLALELRHQGVGILGAALTITLGSFGGYPIAHSHSGAGRDEHDHAGRRQHDDPQWVDRHHDDQRVYRRVAGPLIGRALDTTITLGWSAGVPRTGLPRAGPLTLPVAHATWMACGIRATGKLPWRLTALTLQRVAR